MYGTPSNDPTTDSPFSRKFSEDASPQFLFATGDASQWLIMDRSELLSTNYANVDKHVIKSSTRPTAYNAKMYFGHLSS